MEWLHATIMARSCAGDLVLITTTSSQQSSRQWGQGIRILF
jgi:hypothetical protein